MTLFFLRGKGGGSSSGSSGDINGLAVTIINGQPMLTLEDTTRTIPGSPLEPKVLSVAEQSWEWSENVLYDQDWIQIGNASDGDSGVIADFNGTLVSATGHCENTDINQKDIRIYVNNADVGSIGTLSGGNNATFINTTLDVDFNQGDRIRLRAVNAAGSPLVGTGPIQDTVIKLTIKWRG